MSDHRAMTALRGDASGPGAPTWWIVFSRELRDLWIGGKALYLVLIYALLLGAYSFVLASNAEVKLLPTPEMVAEMVKACIAVALFICLIISADAFSGERDRGTLEGLLLTPTSRRQIVVGKLLAAVSPWPVALAMAIPYWVHLSEGGTVLARALLWGALLGTLLAPALAAVGTLVSLWCGSNKTSMLVSLGVYLLILLPTELFPPNKVKLGFELRRGELFELVNPWAATSRFITREVAGAVPTEHSWIWLTTPIVFVALVLLFLWYASPRAHLDPGTVGKLRSLWNRWRRAPRPAALRTPAATPREPTGTALPDLRTQPRAQVRSPSDRPRLTFIRGDDRGIASRTWWLVLKKELRDLWIGGKALYLCLVLTVVLGGYTYTLARDSVLSMIPPTEMVYEMLKAAIVAGVFAGVIIGADSLSGERERATLEALLLTPTSRRQIVVGKFLGAVSPGPVALAIALLYMKVLSQGDAVFGPAVFWGSIWCALLFPAFTAMGMFVGFWCNSNKSSLFLSLCIYLLFLLPTQLPGRAQAGFMGQLAQWVNPMAAARVFLSKILVNNRTLTDTVVVGPLWSWLMSAVVFAALASCLLFWYAGPGLRLEAGRAIRFRWARAHAVLVWLVASLLALGAAPAVALCQEASPTVPSVAAPPPLQVSIDLHATTVRAGTPVLYNTVVTNAGAEASTPLIVAMNIINLNAKGEVVDPEDWSPQRTQYTEPIAPGQSIKLSWRVNAILDGDYMVYMVVVPPPVGPQVTSHPVTSPGIHLSVTPFTRLNPGGVLPYAVGGPIVLGLIIFVVYRRRHREIDAGS